MIELRPAEIAGGNDTSAEMAVFGAPDIPGTIVDVDVRVTAVADDGRFARWSCAWFGKVEDQIPVVRVAGDGDWTCRIDRRPGQVCLVVAGEDGVRVRWWMDGTVVSYA